MKTTKMINKHLIKAVLCTVLAAPVLSSCELDQYPEDSLQQKEAWATYSDVEKQYVGLLSTIRSAAGSNIFTTELQSDLFNVCAGASNYVKMHDWTFTGNQFDGDVVWASNFSMVKQANEILDHVDQFVAGHADLTEEQLINIENIKGSAYLARAYAYCNLVVRYCKDYEPGTEAEGGTEDALGLPIVRTVDKNAKPARATLKETCAFIEEDMENAEKHLQDLGTTHKPGLDVLTALRARYYLWAHKFDKAIDEAKTITDNYGLASSENEVLSLWLQDNGGEIIFEPQQTTNEQTFSASGIWMNYDIRVENLEMYFFGLNPEYLPTKGLVDMYESSDYRKKAYFSNWYLEQVGLSLGISAPNSTTENGYTFCKYPGNLNLMKQQIWYSEIYNMVKAFRSAEDYLIIAEASLRQANPDEEQARNYLNQLRLARNASEVPESVTGEDLLKIVQEEWTREFVGEGFRLDNLKRWHQGFTRMSPQLFQNPILTSGTNFQQLHVEPDNFRFIWEIPQQDLQANQNLVPNWQAN